MCLFVNSCVNKAIVPINDLNNLPLVYKLTLRAREAHKVDPQSPLAQEKFLLYAEHHFLIFSSILDIEILHQSEFWIADGTFEMCPKPFAQLYTIHGFKNGEGKF